mmetsp:Transcript_24805/g.45492  ORF Transcript_24805/g.45492 Transcript_24805/m.45492 type:complete len:231 (-) Transcript_24805:8-700(-)
MNLVWLFVHLLFQSSKAVDVGKLEVTSDGTMRREVKPSATLQGILANVTRYGETTPPPLTWDESVESTLKDRANISDPWFASVVGSLRHASQENQKRTEEEEIEWKQHVANAMEDAKKDGEKYIPESGYTFGYGPPGPSAYGPEDKPGASGFQGPNGRLNAALDAHKELIKNTTEAAARLKQMMKDTAVAGGVAGYAAASDNETGQAVESDDHVAAGAAPCQSEVAQQGS